MSLNPKITDWHDKVVWLVGATSGIGWAIAQQLHSHGATVIVSGRNVMSLLAHQSSMPRLHLLALDVQEAAQVQHAAAQIQSQHGCVDVLMYCAGYYKPQHATAFDLQEMLRHQSVNYIGVLQVLDAVLPAMVQRRAGHIALIGSVAGYRGLPKALAYGPTKAALNNLAEVLYLDLHPLGLGVSLINPGFVQTKLTAQNDFAMPALLTPAQAAHYVVKDMAAGRFESHFPKRFTLWLKFLRVLPYRLYFSLVAKVAT